MKTPPLCWSWLVLATLTAGSALAGDTRVSGSTPPAIATEPQAEAVVWRLDRLDGFAERAVARVGDPRMSEPTGDLTGPGPAVRFDGVDDGLVVDGIAIAGRSSFTIEVLMRPEAGGQHEQRFLHVDAEPSGRALLELRLDEDGTWCLDTYLRSDVGALTLIDRKRRYPVGKWYWTALRYDGQTMTHYVDGVLEGSGEVRFTPLPAGTGMTSIGMRANRVSWFKGEIAEVVFHPTAIPATELKRVAAK